MVQSQMAPETYAACATRYAKAGIFNVQRASGELLAPEELQSKFGGRDWGLLQNVSIKTDETATRKVAIRVNFDAGGLIQKDDRVASSGMGFKWEPGYLNDAQAACLSYAVMLPANFAFAKGGTLPGLVGEPGQQDGGDEFSLRMRWLEGGRVGIQPVTPKERSGRLLTLNDKWLTLPKQRWFDIEQEVVLNTPGQHDGVLRVWVDGTLVLNRQGIAFRKDASGRFAGVLADTHYSDSKMAWVPAPKATALKLSPLVVRWN
jgi:hypothetical protein